MIRIRVSDLSEWIRRCLASFNMSVENIRTATDIVMRATLRGVGHHDIYDFPSRIQGLRDGKIAINPEFQQLAAFNALESWDGGNGLGELVCSFAMHRAMRLADKYGIGLCAMRGSNHYMAAAPYVEIASEKGYVAMLFCKGAPTMGAPGRIEKVIGTLPMGYAIPTNHEYPILFDACMAYASFGALKEVMDRNEKVPLHWGFDEEGKQTDDPKRLAKGTRSPIGGHKGFGLAIFGEMITALLSQGCIVDEEDTVHMQKSPTSHTAIAINVGALMGGESFRQRSSELIERMQARAANLRIPGQGSASNKRKILDAGVIELCDDLVNKFDEYSIQLKIVKIRRKV